MKTFRLFTITGLLVVCCIFTNCSFQHKNAKIATGIFQEHFLEYSDTLYWSIFEDGVMEISRKDKVSDFSLSDFSKWRVDSASINGHYQSIQTYYEEYLSKGWPNDQIANDLNNILQTEVFDKVENIIIKVDSISYIQNLCLNLPNLKNIQLPPSVSSIYRSFNYLPNLKNIQLPPSVSSIDESFNDLPNLEKVNAQGVSNLEESFNNCPKLTDFNYSKEIKSVIYSLINTHFIMPTIIRNKTIIHFANDYEGAYIIPDSIEKISESAFFNCKQLTEIRFTRPSMEIGHAAFAYCENLKSVYNFPELLAPLEERGTEDEWMSRNRMDEMFLNCCNLEDITLPYSEYQWKLFQTFEGCQNLKSVTINGPARFIRSFIGCSNLSAVTLNPSLSFEFDHMVFEGCTQLREFYFPMKSEFSNCGYGAYRMFANCTSLESIEIPDKVKGIGSSAFEGCTSLSNVTLPENLIEIEDGAFRNCNIHTLYIPTSVTRIGYEAFSYNPIEKIYCAQFFDIIDNYSTSFFECNNIKDVYCNDYTLRRSFRYLSIDTNTNFHPYSK